MRVLRLPRACRMRRPQTTFFVAALALALFGQACTVTSRETIETSLQSSGTFEHAIHVGDEEGVVIAVQARHFAVSEIRRGAETQFDAVYVYRPAAGYVGSDYVELEISRGSDGATAPTKVTRLAIRITVHE